MNGKRNNGDEILYLDEVSKPLTSTESEVAPSIGLRAGFASETDGNLTDTSRQSFTETEIDEHNRQVDKQPPIGFNNRNDPSLPASQPQSGWLNRFFPSPASPMEVVTPDVNIYQHKKTLAQGMMDLALLSANANQMRYVLQTDGRHTYFYPALIMISMSLFLQIAVGIGLIWNSVYNVKQHEEMCKANKANNWTVIGIFLVTILNVFISSFGVVDQTVIITT